jgi:tRNA A37 methylthiotransferase MiaB
VAKVRNKTLRKIFANTGQQFRERFIGNTMVVLWESCVQNEDGLWQLSGLTDNYIRVISHADTNLWNQISAVKLTAHAPGRNALNGHIVGGVTHRN